MISKEKLESKFRDRCLKVVVFVSNTFTTKGIPKLAMLHRKVFGGDLIAVNQVIWKKVLAQGRKKWRWKFGSQLCEAILVRYFRGSNVFKL